MTGDDATDTTEHADDAGPGGETPPIPGMEEGARDGAYHPDRDGPVDDIGDAESPHPGRIGAIRLAMRVPWGEKHGWGPKGFPPLRLIEQAYPVLTVAERDTLRSVYGTEGRDPEEASGRADKLAKLAAARKTAEESLILACTIIANDEAETCTDPHTNHHDPESGPRG